MVSSSTEPDTSRRGLPPTAPVWAGTVLISFSAVWVRLADVEALRSSFLRVAYALPVFAVLILVRRIRRPFVPLAALAGAFLGLDLMAWHVSIGIIGAGLATVLPNLQVVVVGLIGVVWLHERPRPLFWWALPVVLVGVWLMAAVGKPVVTGGSVPLGFGFGLATAVTYSVYLVVVRQARVHRPHVDVVAVMASATLGATVVIGIGAAMQGVAGPAREWPADGWLILLALGSQVVGWLLLTTSIHRLPAALTSVALLLQPVLAMVWGALLLNEPVGPPQVAGAALVLIGVVAAQRASSAPRTGEITGT